MAGEKIELKDAAFGNLNTNMHGTTLDGLQDSLRAKFRPEDENLPNEFIVEREIDFDKVGYKNGFLRNHSMLKSNYNFDISVCNFQTKVITNIVEVEQMKVKNVKAEMSSDLRKKLVDCLQHIEGLEHAYAVKIFGVDNPTFVFCELVRTNGLGVAGDRHNDGFYEIPVREICGVSTDIIERRIRRKLLGFD